MKDLIVAFIVCRILKKPESVIQAMGGVNISSGQPTEVSKLFPDSSVSSAPQSAIHCVVVVVYQLMIVNIS